MIRCAECKGRGLCGLLRCPVTSRFHARMKTVPSSDRYQGSAPSVFIGSFGYPDVRGGPLLVNDPDNPPDWLARGLSIDEVVGIRAGTIRGSSLPSRFESPLQEIALSQKPVDVEVVFERPVRFDLTFDGTVAPVGLTGSLRNMDVLDNASVDRAVDRVTSDTDLGAVESCTILRDADIDVYQIGKLMTAGLLGRKRRFVPTRWAITAVDDAVSTELKRRISRNPAAPEIQVFSGEVFGNRIVCILIPGDWKFEMIEIWGKHTLWGGDTEAIVQDREGMKKSSYSPITGAYYSARLAVTEYLARTGRVGRAIVIRSVSSEYWAPLGTWVIREASRRAMNSPAIPCETLSQAIDTASGILGFSHWTRHSTLIPELRTQKTLSEF